jgi:hypothetical protein
MIIGIIYLLPNSFCLGLQLPAKRVFSKEEIEIVCKLAKELKNIQSIANTIVCDRRQVEKILSENSIEKLNMLQLNRIKYPLLTDKEWMDTKYHTEGLSHQDIADLIGCSSQMIVNAFKELKIKSREPNKGRLIKLLGANVDHVTTVWLKEQYEGKKRSIRSICSELGVSSLPIERHLIKLGIPIRTRGEQNTRLTKNQRLNAKIAGHMRTRLWIAIRAQKASKLISTTEEAIGETDVASYIESLFKPGMTWDNHGGADGWEIDHIIPLASFNLNNREEQLAAAKYTNLQPLWRHENRTKSNSVPEKDRPLVYLVAGLNGVGKTWVCEQLDKSLCSYIPYDAISKDKHYYSILAASEHGRPVIYDNPYDARTFYKNNKNSLNIKLITINEKEDVIIDRLLGRGSNHKTIAKVLNRTGKIHRLIKVSDYVGTSKEVLDYLNSELSK